MFPRPSWRRCTVRRSRCRRRPSSFPRARCNPTRSLTTSDSLFFAVGRLRQGVARCEKLLEAAAIKPPGSPERRECVDRIRNELQTPANAGAVGQLATRTKDAELSAELLIRQSELTTDAGLAAEILWKLYRAGQLDDVRLGWACQIWNLAKHPQRVIEACESTMRVGGELPVAALTELAMSYTAEHRDVDARRAASRDTEPAVALPDATGAVPPRPAGGFF